MDLAANLKQAFEIVKLNGPVAAEVGKNEQSLQPGLIFIAGAGLASGLSGLMFHGGIGGLVTLPIMAVLGYFVGVGILHIVATTFFGGQGDYMALLRAEAHAAIIGWAAIVPFLGALVGLWHLPVSVVILQNVYGMSRDQAIKTVAVIAGVALLFMLISVFFFGAMLGGMMLGRGGR